ncbi:hypothetical protein VQ02_25615 [Methylobacterium variabile]|uniref:Uncharacterized protein n=1 Tax=Methylobacterium variabile TaxID=298794 RepID=A0A0J6SD48_9HYPH|nr:hypothetical protein [Methylobacterium variabile]KMO31657.1 hypothetical protein VQ02_25615 [Methylobacterium variabile]
MTAFITLERAALQSIVSETPVLARALDRQMIAATVTRRENTGAGFFTAIAVPSLVPRVDGPRVLGCETPARIPG